MELKDKIPPHNLEAEKATLGALLLDWSKIDEVGTMLTPDNFYSPQNKVIFESLRNLSQRGVRGDLLTLIDDLTKEKNLEKAGGVSYISTLTDSVPTSANVDYYANIVHDSFMRRELLALSSEMKKDTYDESRNSKIILEETEQKIFRLADTNQTTNLHQMKDLVPSTIQLIDMRYKNKGECSGIPSGFTMLDSMTSGFQNSEMIIIGARPSMGKTALALSMMQNIAIDNNIPCGFFSLEMSANQIGQRLLSQVSRVPGQRIRSGLLSMADFKKLQEAGSLCYEAPLYIADTPNMKLLDLRAMARRMKANHGVKIIFIDYIGLITTENDGAPVYEQQAQVSKSLKSLARELEIPLVVLCQVTRDKEGADPGLADLRGSGSIEQDADVVMFIAGERHKTNTDDPDATPGVLDRKLIVAKQRNGPIGDVELIFLSSCTRFENKSNQQE